VLLLRSYERISAENRRFHSNGVSFSQIFRYKGSLSTNYSYQKTRLNDLSYGINIWTELSSVWSPITLLTDRRTDSFLVASSRWHSMQRVKRRSWSYIRAVMIISIAGDRHSSHQMGFYMGQAVGQLYSVRLMKLLASLSTCALSARPPETVQTKA